MDLNYDSNVTDFYPVEMDIYCKFSESLNSMAE